MRGASALGDRHQKAADAGHKGIAMGAPSTSNIPRAGDIVIYERDASAGIYLLSAFQHASQLTFRKYDDAVRDAGTFAAKNRVDAWYTVNGESYQLMARHRRERHPA